MYRGSLFGEAALHICDLDVLHAQRFEHPHRVLKRLVKRACIDDQLFYARANRSGEFILGGLRVVKPLKDDHVYPGIKTA